MLQEILVTADVRAAQAAEDVDALTDRARAQGPARDLAAALRAPGLSVIAEIKRRSPSAGDIDTSLEFEKEIARGCEGIKPGWVRVSFNYFTTEAVFEFIVDAVHTVATDGWRLLPRYEFDPDTALWEHRDGRGDAPLSLSEIDYTRGGMRYTVEPQHDADSVLAIFPKTETDADEGDDSEIDALVEERNAARASKKVA